MKTPIRFPITSGSRFRAGMTLFTSAVVTLLLWMVATGARAQPKTKPIAADKTAPAAHPTPTPTPTCSPPQSTPPPAEGDLKFVVALFRHGVRSPLQKFAEATGPHHAGTPWPGLADWDEDKCANWGDLTPHGGKAVTLLGKWYGNYYSKAWGKSFKAYLWADVDERTEQTAVALATGLGTSGVSVKLGSLYPEKVDPLFHPFEAGCGTPDPSELQRIVKEINDNHRDWLGSSSEPLDKLYDVLACKTESGNKTLAQGPSPTPSPCEPLSSVKENASAWGPATPTPRPSSPIKWDGQFSYASSATEAFLLEYANGMTPGWGQLSGPDLSDLLRLHEFYFDITERDEYLARVQGANLLREILTQLNRKAGRKLPDGTCPRGDVDNQFVGLVGHDTSLANLGELLNIRWIFNDPRLPDDTRNLPDNDALPAGALVFELREGKPDYQVRIQYVTQSLNEIRTLPQSGDAYRLQTTCGTPCQPCEMPLTKFSQIAGDIIKKLDPLLLSKCQNGVQTCP